MRHFLLLMAIMLFTNMTIMAQKMYITIDGRTESELRTFLKAGESNISVTLSVTAPTGVSHVNADGSSSKAYTLQGTVAQTGHKEIVIQNGKKIIK